MVKLYAVIMKDLFGLMKIHYTTLSKDEAIKRCKQYLKEEQKKPPLERRRFFVLELEKVDSDD